MPDPFSSTFDRVHACQSLRSFPIPPTSSQVISGSKHLRLTLILTASPPNSISSTSATAKMTCDATLSMNIFSSDPPFNQDHHFRKQECRHYEPQDAARRPKNDAYSLNDEEEVIFELDEAALSKLPLHLQNNMREIQAERVHRLQKEHKGSLHHRVRTHDDFIESDKEIYAEKWYQNMLAKVAATRELEAQTMNEMDPEITRPEGMAWCPMRHGWAAKSAACEASRTRGRGRGWRMPLAMSSDTCVAGLRDPRQCSMGCSPCAETAASKGYYVSTCNGRRVSLHNSYMSWRCAGPYYVYEAGADKKVWERERGFSKDPRKRCLAFVSEVCDNIRVRFQRAKNAFSK